MGNGMRNGFAYNSGLGFKAPIHGRNKKRKDWAVHKSRSARRTRFVRRARRSALALLLGAAAFVGAWFLLR